MRIGIDLESGVLTSTRDCLTDLIISTNCSIVCLLSSNTNSSLTVGHAAFTIVSPSCGKLCQIFQLQMA